MRALVRGIPVLVLALAASPPNAQACSRTQFHSVVDAARFVGDTAYVVLSGFDEIHGHVFNARH